LLGEGDRLALSNTITSLLIAYTSGVWLISIRVVDSFASSEGNLIPLARLSNTL
jgi:hypothetical protein